MKKWVYLSILFLLFLIPQFLKSEEVVHVCTWYDLLPESVIKDFEKETKIKVVCDFFDNNDILEAKLLTENVGYDVVTPTAVPYLSRGMELGLYEKLNKEYLPNLKYVSPILFEKTKSLKDYGIAYGFGTFGILYNPKVVNKIFPTINSYAVFFDPQNVKKVAPYGVALNDDALDVLASVCDFYQISDENKAYAILEEIRPYIKYFNISRHANDMNMQEIVLSLTPNHEAVRAVVSSKKIQLQFFIPPSEKTLWCDMLAIAKGAPHLKNDYRFINFLLRPDIAARITNETLLPNSVSFQNREFVEKEIQDNPQLFLPHLEHYHLHKTKTLTEYREISERWIRIITRKK